MYSFSTFTHQQLRKYMFKYLPIWNLSHICVFTHWGLYYVLNLAHGCLYYIPGLANGGVVPCACVNARPQVAMSCIILDTTKEGRGGDWVGFCRQLNAGGSRPTWRGNSKSIPDTGRVLIMNREDQKFQISKLCPHTAKIYYGKNSTLTLQKLRKN